jgi:hypothetical protein
MIGALGVPMIERISPHPVPLPLGEGTVSHAPSVIQASLLPGGEGQDEGSDASDLLKTRALEAEPA